MTVTRDSFFAQFGPLEQEALILVLLDQINVLRAELGKPAVTKQQAYDALQAKLNTLAPYDWMEESP